MKRVLTYGTFDVLHYAHIEFLRKAKSYGDYLIVGVSNDDFNENVKHKKAYYPYKIRKKMIDAIKYVDKTIEQKSFEQKKEDILKYNIDVLISSEEYRGKYDYLKEYCKVVYLKKGKNISSTKVRNENSLEGIIESIEV